MNYEQICLSTCDVARKAGAFIKEQLSNISAEKIETKGTHNYVTYVDKTAEKIIVDNLSLVLPESGFIAEEGTSEHCGERFNWIIDPLDGTTNFIHGLSPFAVSIALMENNEIVVGVIYEVSLDECFYAWKNGSAMLNGKQISVSRAKSVNDSLIATGFPYHDYSLVPKFLETLDYFMRNSHGMRRLGSAATDLAYVACGRFEAFYEYGLNAWDVAAGALIVERAGGKVSDFKGGNDYIFGKELVSSNSLVHEEFLGVVKSYLC